MPPLLTALPSTARRSFLAGVAIAVVPTPARAQATSQTPLRLVVPFTPGTGIDLIARTVAPRLSERLGRPVIVENRAGASGNIGTEAVARAKPDGQTLLVSVSTLVMNRTLYPRLPFDPLRDLVPVSQTSWGQLVLVAHPGAGIASVADLVRAARARPGRLNYASPGVGTPHHLSMELLKSEAEMFVTHIPYSGTAPALTDLLSGQIETMFLPIHVALPHVRSGKLLALAIGSDRRHPLLPALPTLEESGVARINVDMWYGVFAPPGTPATEVARLNRELQDILASPEVAAAFRTQGMDPAGGTPEAFARLVERDAQRWARLIESRRITAE